MTGYPTGLTRSDKILNITPFLSTFFWDNGAGSIMYDTRAKCPSSSYFLKWGASLLPRKIISQCLWSNKLLSWSQKNSWDRGSCPVTKTSSYEVKRKISQHLPVTQISYLIQRQYGSAKSEARNIPRLLSEPPLLPGRWEGCPFPPVCLGSNRDAKTYNVPTMIVYKKFYLG